MEIVAYMGFPPDGYWCQGLAISNSLLSGWKLFKNDIKNENGNHTKSDLFYTDLYGWKALATTYGSGSIYLADIVTDTEPIPPDPPNNDEIVLEAKALLQQVNNLLDEIE